MKNSVLGITLLALCSVSFAQVPALQRATSPANEQHLASSKQAVLQQHPAPASSTDCAFDFTTGSNNTFLHYCVTGNGNVVVLETPQEVPEVSSSKGEGYGLCDLETGVAYSDFGGFQDVNGSGNWGPATVVSHSATALKITRTTFDGAFTLTQNIMRVGGTMPAVKITMTLKNNTGNEKHAFLMRYADVDADDAQQNNLDGTFATAMAYNSIAGSLGTVAAFGLMVQNVGNTPFSFDAFAQNTFEPPNPCQPFAHLTGPTVADGSIVQLYEVDLPKNSSGTASVAYRGM